MLPLPDSSAAYIDAKSQRPSKDFYNWLKGIEVRSGVDTSRFNIVNYGGDTGASDNTSALQAAIDAASAVDGGGTVTASPGSYRLRNGVLVPATPGNTVILDFAGAEFYVQDDTISTLFTLQNQFAQLKNTFIQHFGSGNVTDLVATENAHQVFFENVTLGGEFGTVFNCVRLLNASDHVFANCTLGFCGNGVFCETRANFLMFFKGAFFRCDIGFRCDDNNIQCPYFNGVVSVECTTADYQLDGAYCPAWINCDIEGTSGSPLIGKSFNFTDAVFGATIQNNFFAFRDETIENLYSSSFIHNALYNNNTSFDGSSIDVDVRDNFIVDGSASSVTANGMDILEVSQLPAISDVAPGTRKTVSDATVTTRLSIVAGGGGNMVPIFSDGTNWLID